MLTDMNPTILPHPGSTCRDQGIVSVEGILLKWHPSILIQLREHAVSRDKCAAFAMGNEERLGVGSLVRSIDPGIVRMVIDLVLESPKLNLKIRKE
jgi:hypothetical protein